MEKIKIFRKQIGISARELARRSKLDIAVISNIENGKTKNPGIYTVKRIADALNIKIDDLIN
ncbi:MAG: helix-turn-helix transcriptional regulator [Clostridium sp.]|uniref:helix-turn-helix domain-containing protein n=1 Tax=Clostridium sp. TaxID=1506 RepID=UPI002A91293A|nr:helix-turn-helix transcriptional regulator [Clostridium sp.]MDY6226536.1 helix-turn-helix transcriptional regulator [Clostridium sp.]